MAEANTVQFIIKTDLPVSNEQRAAICGDLEGLGGWAPSKALLLQTLTHEGGTSGRIFVGQASLPAGADRVEFKLLLSADGAAADADEWQWESGDNRCLHLKSYCVPVAAGGAGSVSTALLSWYPGSDGASDLVASDEYLAPHRPALEHRYRLFLGLLGRVEQAATYEWAEAVRQRTAPISMAALLAFSPLDAFSRGYERMGLTRGQGPAGAGGFWFREWAPGAEAASLVGDFNDWDPSRNPLMRTAHGHWVGFVPDPSPGSPAIQHASSYKVALRLPGSDEFVHRISAWCKFALFDPTAKAMVPCVWEPSLPGAAAAAQARDRCLPAMPATGPRGMLEAPAHAFTTRRLRLAGVWAEGGRSGFPAIGAAAADSAAGAAAAGAAPAAAAGAASPDGERASALETGLRVYEAHIGIAGEGEPLIHTYREFIDNVLPRIKKLGYNAVQLMAVAEHSLYSSFGYLVNCFFAPTSRYGSPEGLRAVVDAAHGMGIAVIVDLVHSHASSNVADGLNQFDGTDHCYFHEGARGRHEAWGSRLFNYNHTEVLRFLLSNLRYWVEEFRVDGFRFDGITSMLYKHHGLGTGFTGGYHEYFGGNLDDEAQGYLMLANLLCHSLETPAITIAEDVSGMPTLCRPVREGGVGFDYRLAMALPDMWIKMLKEQRDEDWDMGHITHTLTNRRWQEKSIAYAESHDQALVGDKTLAMWLMDAELYDNMSVLQAESPVVHRGMALHKMIRLVTCGLGGEGFLAFMGNEFGHPEWLDFPRQENGDSYHYARRQWHLVDDGLLRYKFLFRWDAAMSCLQREGGHPWLRWPENFVSQKHEANKTIVFERGSGQKAVVFVFNFHATESRPDYQIGVPEPGTWRLALCSDSVEFGGSGRVDEDACFEAAAGSWDGRPASLRLYSPARSALVLTRDGSAGPAAVARLRAQWRRADGGD